MHEVSDFSFSTHLKTPACLLKNPLFNQKTLTLFYYYFNREFNKKKIDSHGWAFNAFCPLLEPEVVVLLDMGTNPANDALYHFWKHFDNEPRLGGVCGEIVVDVAGSWLLKR